MRYLSFSLTGEDSARLGALIGENMVIDLSKTEDQPATMQALLEAGPERWQQNFELFSKLDPNDQPYTSWELDKVIVHTPLARPNSLRDFYAFEEHVATANANRGRQVPKEWYEVPVFYFSNPYAVYGPNEDVPMPAYTEALDYELEVAVIIGTAGRDIKADDALEHIFGFTIFNDWSARDVQRQEMKVGLGPAKGKDFASSFGPYIVTPDELKDHETGHLGVYDLEMIARINGEEFSRGNWKTLHYSFGEMIARASEEVMLYPGDIIGSGTVGTGCLLELTKGEGPWLQKGDVVELEIEELGVLRNKAL